MINLHKGILPILSTSGFPPPPENAIPDPRFIESKLIYHVFGKNSLVEIFPKLADFSNFRVKYFLRTIGVSF